jgi:(hydroxyamino)benzene mutase
MEAAMDASQLLCFAGLALFLLGLINGFAIPRMKSPRLGLSAHLTAVQCGTFLIAAGLMWPRLAFSPIWSDVLANGLWVSLGLIWLALLLAGFFGAGQGFVIAGQGMTTTPARQRLVTVPLIAGSLGSLLAVAAVLALWRWR